MSTLSFTEENYLKSMYMLQQGNGSDEVSVNEISERMQTRPATVTDMLRRLSEKKLIHYEKYKKIRLSSRGRGVALQILRKHRLWETFLHDKLEFSWDEVHEVAEQLEHIHSPKLIARLDAYLGYPGYDPHGDPIPNEAGEIPESASILLKDLPENEEAKIVAVKDTSPSFLQQLERYGLQIGVAVSVKEKMPFDGSLVLLTGTEPFSVSEKVARNILVLQKKQAATRGRKTKTG